MFIDKNFKLFYSFRKADVINMSVYIIVVWFSHD